MAESTRLIGELETIALIDNLREIKNWAERCWLDSKQPLDRMSGMLLAIEEAFANICFHGYKGVPGPVRFMCLIYADNSIIFTITDWASLFDVTKVDEPDTKLLLGERKIGGLGVLLIRQMADEVIWRFENDSNVLSLKFNFVRENGER